MRLRLRSQEHGCSARIGWFPAGLLFSLHVGAFSAVATGGTSYTEDLTLERLGKHHVAARFVFRSHWVPQASHRCQNYEDWHEEGETEGGLGRTRVAEGKLCHFEAVFPRAVGVLLDRFKARIARLSGGAGLGEHCQELCGIVMLVCSSSDPSLCFPSTFKIAQICLPLLAAENARQSSGTARGTTLVASGTGAHSCYAALLL